MHSGRSGYSWDLNKINIPITQFSLKNTLKSLRDPDRLECIAFPKTPIRSIDKQRQFFPLKTDYVIKSEIYELQEIHFYFLFRQVEEEISGCFKGKHHRVLRYKYKHKMLNQNCRRNKGGKKRFSSPRTTTFWRLWYISSIYWSICLLSTYFLLCTMYVLYITLKNSFYEYIIHCHNQ